MKIYLAASYYKRIEMSYYASALQSDGFIVTSDWITGIHEQTPWTEATYSMADLKSIREADVFLSFTEHSDAHPRYMRGGRHVEFGYAYAHYRVIIIVGPRENSFYHLPNVMQFDKFDQAREYLKRLARDLDKP